MAGVVAMLFGFLCCGLVSLLTSGALAQTRTVEQEAALHVQRGRALLREGHAERALHELRRAGALSESREVLFEMARCFDVLNDHAAATGAYRAYLAADGERISAARRRRVEQQLSAHAEHVAELALVVAPEDAQLWLDDQLIANDGSARRILVNAGQHTLRAQRAGHVSHELKIELRGGEQRTISVTLRSRAGELSVAASSQETLRELRENGPTRRRDALAERGEAPTDPRRTLKVAGFVSSGALAATAATTAAIAYSVGEQRAAMLEDDPQDVRRADILRDRERRLDVTTDVLLSSAVAAFGLSLYLTLSEAESESEEPLRLKIRPHRMRGAMFSIDTDLFR